MEKMIMEMNQGFEYLEEKKKKPQEQIRKPHTANPQQNKQDPLYLPFQLNYELIEEYLG
ncbi:hypothetical protein [Bacillus pinisoli]|uniref:hypothetical protein n=1 Tax=Bacillus pinisoli TaxID=2901866 RepID=UPI001FF48738|nr:hypothetical protein [Bacillus pinisoli]